jgi:8-oxo-dGTP diphosphatase
MAPYRSSDFMIHVVIAIILNAEREVLIARRLPHQEKGGMWEFPGGKVEVNETPFQALQREIKEEIGIDVIAAEQWAIVEYHYPHKSVMLDTWMVNQFEGEPRGAEGQEIRWGNHIDLTAKEYPEGNQLLIDKLLDFLAEEN